MSRSKKRSTKNKQSTKQLLPGFKGRFVKRTDVNKNKYFIDRKTGKRVSKNLWVEEREKIKSELEQFQKERSNKFEEERSISPFPAGVSSEGVPGMDADSRALQPRTEAFGEYSTPGARPTVGSESGRRDREIDEEVAFELDDDSDFEWYPIEGEDETG